MKRMTTCDREICIVSGHNGAGKSHYFDYLSGLPEYQGPDVFKLRKDLVYVRYYGGRTGRQVEDNQDGYLEVYKAITPADRLYSDELIRVDVERAILIHGAKRVLLDATMRTRRIHQAPFVAMVKKTEKWLHLIESDRAEAQGLLAPEPLPRVHVRVVFLFCDFETARKRMEKRWKNPLRAKGGLPPSFIESTMGLEIPTAYPFLAIDTSDERTSSDHARRREIRAFFEGRAFNLELMACRAQQARQAIATSKREIQRALKLNG